MSETPRRAKGPASMVKVTKKSKSDTTSTGESSAMSSIPEGSSLLLDGSDEEGDPTLHRNSKSNTEQTSNQGSSEQDEIAELMVKGNTDQKLNFILAKMFQQDTDNKVLLQRLERVESSNVAKELYPSKKHQKVKKHSILDSVTESAQKGNWKEMTKNLATKGRSGGDPDNDPSDDSDSDFSDSSSGSNSHASQEQDPDEGSRGNAPGNGKDKDGDDKKYSNSLFKTLDSTRKRAAQTIVQVTRVEKEFNLKIYHFILHHVCRIMRSIIQFQETEGIAVNMSRVLMPNVKQHLAIKYKITNDDLQTMELSTLFTFIAKETKVHNKIKFYKELQKTMAGFELMDFAKVHPWNYEKYYFQQLKLADDFETAVRLMLIENKKCCPDLSIKKDGLISLFQSFHSDDYWRTAWSEMTKRYSKIDKFLEDYRRVALMFYQVNQSYSTLPHIRSKPSAESHSKSNDKEKKYYDTKRAIGKSFRANDRNNDLHHLDEAGNLDSMMDRGFDLYPSEDEHEDDTWVNANPENAKDSSSKVDEGEDSMSEASNESEDEPDSDERLLAAFNDHQQASGRTDPKEFACLRKILSGKCEKSDCPYGHRRDVLVKGAANMIDKLKAFQNAQGEPNRTGKAHTPYKVLQKDKYKH
jgi:hypothetical protein